jgi:Protein of unknown function (DUF3455)
MQQVCKLFLEEWRFMRIFAKTSMMGKKVRGALVVLLAFFIGRGYGQELQAPASVQVPAGSKLLLRVNGRGVQVYTCQASAADSNQYTWVLLEAKAILYAGAEYGQKTVRHYFNAKHHPVWETEDGSSVEGTKLEQADAPDPGDIPWLLLKASSSSGTGPIVSTAFIQRINTRGGKAPGPKADVSQKGEKIEVAYTAEYLFYGN